MRKFTKYPSTIKASSKGTFHMSSTTFDKMARENSLMYGLDKSEYDEVRDLADSGNIRRDGLVNTIAVSSNITLDEADKILRKYESITSAKFVPARQLGMFNHRYEVHCDTSSRPDVLLAASDKLESAEAMAKRQIDRIASSPWESKENKLRSLDSLYIYDTQTDDEATTQTVEDYIELAKQKVEKQAVKSSTDARYSTELNWDDIVNIAKQYKKESDQVVRVNSQGIVITDADNTYTVGASKDHVLDSIKSDPDFEKNFQMDAYSVLDYVDEDEAAAYGYKDVADYRSQKKEILNKYGFGRPSKKVEQSEQVCCFTKSDDDDFDYDSVDYNADSEYQPERDEIEMGMSWDLMDGQFTYTVTGFQAGRVHLSMDGYENGKEVHEDLIAIKKKDEAGEYLTTKDNPYLKLYAVEGYVPDNDYDEYYTSAYHGDYGPSNPWNAPGMSYRDFI